MPHRRARLSRRAFLQAAGSTLALAALPDPVTAQAAPIKLGTLTPLTGAGGSYGPSMRKAMEFVAQEVNAAGGVLGRPLQLVSEDDQTNPEAAVRAARKLIDVDKVAAIMGTWASAVTTAVAPLCWESKTFLTTVSGSDTITQLPHQGYLIRTQPNTNLQIGKLGDFLISLKVKRVFVLAAQTPFALPSQKRLQELLPKGGAELVGAVIYDKDKTTFRSEIDQALRAKPDMIYLNGYTPDCTVLLKELFKAGYTGAKVAQGYAVNQKLLDSVPGRGQRRDLHRHALTRRRLRGLQAAGRVPRRQRSRSVLLPVPRSRSAWWCWRSRRPRARPPARRSATPCGRSPRAAAPRWTAPSPG